MATATTFWSDSGKPELQTTASRCGRATGVPYRCAAITSRAFVTRKSNASMYNGKTRTNRSARSTDEHSSACPVSWSRLALSVNVSVSQPPLLKLVQQPAAQKAGGAETVGFRAAHDD